MSEFLASIAESRTKKIVLDELKRVFYTLNPDVINSPDRSTRLLAALRELEQQGAIRLPASSSWDNRGNPALPLFVTLVREADRDTRDYSFEPWLPEFGFWPQLSGNQLEDAKAINDWLLRRRAAFLPVPLKERSLEIFGDEKRLDALRSGAFLFGGRMALAAIGAFHVPAPLPYRQAMSESTRLLVVENHNSFWSFSEWNKTAGRYRAVVYGAGNGFSGAGEALVQVVHEVCGEDIEYLGDLDPKGMHIPLDFNRLARNWGVGVSPAVEWYDWLLERGRQRTKPSGQIALDESAVRWLGEQMGTKLIALWKEGLWIPQESLGYEQLVRWPA
jgi:hypothetical protein